MAFRELGFVVHVRGFGGLNITGQILPEFLKTVFICRLKE